MKLTREEVLELDNLILAASNTSFDCGAFDMDADTETIEAYRKLNDAAHAAKDALRQYVMSGPGMQPPNNQPSLICKSCGVDRSKEDCKGDRLRCGLAGVAYSDHVAVISAKPDSVHLAVPVETATDPSLKTWPERIWLQHGDSPDVPEFSEVADAVTWCVDQIESSDVEYVRADLQSGISSPTHRPNEQNDVVQEGKQ